MQSETLDNGKSTLIRILKAVFGTSVISGVKDAGRAA